MQREKEGGGGGGGNDGKWWVGGMLGAAVGMGRVDLEPGRHGLGGMLQ
jgi:hypothetical protein